MSVPQAGRLPVIRAAATALLCAIATRGHVANAATFAITAYEWHNTIYRNGVPVTPGCVKRPDR
jgi:hypothetical protein